MRRLRPILFACLLAALLPPTVVHAAEESAPHPLLELARERESLRSRQPRPVPGAPAASAARHALEQSRPPATEDCAGTLGAIRFAMLHADLAAALSGEGDFAGAAAEYREALACRPRDQGVLAALAEALFDARDIPGAREAIEASLARDPRAVSANRVAGNIAFVEERWAEAISRFRYVAASDEDRNQAGYGQLMYWLSQRRAGIARPEFVDRAPGEGWPQPLLLFMRGEYTEAELIEPILEGDSTLNSQPNTSTDERLCEALYYVGQEYWARGDKQAARDFLTALVNIRVLYFLEHGLALAEIEKLR